MKTFRVITAAMGLALASAPAVAQGEGADIAALRAAQDETDLNADPAAYEAKARATLARFRQEQPGDASLQAMAESWVAMGLAGQGQVAPAQEIFERILPQLEQAPAAYAQVRADAVNTYGLVLFLQGKYAEARPIIEQSVELQRAIPDAAPQILAERLDSLSSAAWHSGDRDMALATNLEALAIAATLDPVPPTVATFYGNRVFYLRGVGDIAGAAKAGRDGIAFLEPRLPEDHPLLANLYANAAVMLRLQGRPSAAFPLARRAYEIVEKPAGPNQTSAFMRAMAATTLATSGDWETASAMIEQALPILDEQLGAEAEQTRRVRVLYARVLAQSGRAAEGRRIAQEMVASADANLPATHAGRIEPRLALAKVAEAQGDYAVAALAMNEGVGLRRAIAPASHPDLLTERSYALFLTGRSLPAGQRAGLGGEAHDLFDALVAGAQRDPAAPLTEDARASFAYLAEVLHEAGDHETAWLAQQWAARTSVDDAALSTALGRVAANSDAAPLLDERRQLVVKRSTLLSTVAKRLADGEGGLAAIEDELAAIDGELAALDMRLAASGLDAARFATLSLDELAARVPGTAAFAQLTQLRDGWLVTAIAGGQSWQYRPQASATELAELTGAVRATLDPLALETPFDRAASARLFAALFPADLQAALVRAGEIRIAANGALGSLPFSVLVPDADAGRFLVDYAPVMRLPGPPRSTQAPGAGAASQLFAMGDVSLGDAMPDLLRSGTGGAVVDLPQLPSAAQELASLAKSFGKGAATVLLGDAATEQALRDAALADGAVLAFATHGLVSGEVEGLTEPALVLHPEQPDDGLLKASEIAALDLPARWVILSACNTAAAAGPDAAGLSGLAQAFILAGAENILATHWPVRDDVAAAISTGTLARAQQGLAPAAALRGAMLDVRDGGAIREGAHPALWAPFEMIGY